MNIQKLIQLLFIILLVGNYNCISQQVTFEIPHHNNVYVDIQCPVEIKVEERQCGDFKVRVNNGVITGGGCKYEITADKPGDCDILVYSMYYDDTIKLSGHTIKVLPVPLPFATLCKKREGLIKLSEIKNYRFLELILEDFEFEYTYTMKAYNFILLRNGQTVFQEKVQGDMITETILAALSKANKGDNIIVKEIIVVGKNYKLNTIGNIELVLDK
jgi:hypothetical protein